MLEQAVKKEKDVVVELTEKEIKDQAVPTLAEKRELAYEEKARKQGWKPEDEWDGDPADWKPAKEFVRDGEFIDQIKSLKSELVKRDLRVEEENKQIRQFVQDLKKTEYERGLRDLVAAQKQAIQNEDTKEAAKLERQIAKTEEKIEEVDKAKEDIKKESPGPTPEFISWSDKNKWYLEDGDLRVEADGLAIAYTAKNPGLGNTAEGRVKILEYVEKKIKKNNPEYFGKKDMNGEEVVEKKKVAFVESSARGNAPGAKKSKYSKADLTEDQLKIFNTIVKDRKIMTEEQYFKDFEANLNRS